MDRAILYPGAIPLAEDSLNAQRQAMINDGAIVRALIGTSPAVDGLACTPTVPASLNVNIGPGAIFAPSVVDSSAYSVLPTDPRALVKVGVNLDSVAFPLTAPTTSGYSVNYLLCAAFSETDTGDSVLRYYNAAVPSQPFSGPGGSGAVQHTVRQQRVGLQLVAGAAAPAGSQSTPPAPTGFVPLYIVTLNFGQTEIRAEHVVVHPQAPFLSSKAGDFATRTQLAAAVAPLATQAALAAGLASRAPVDSPVLTGAPQTAAPDAADDSGRIPTTHWVRVVANAIAQAWAATRRPGYSEIQSFGSSTWWQVPAGITRVKVTATGSGGGGCASRTPGDGTYVSGAGGGAGGTAIGAFDVTPGQMILITVPDGGAGGTAAGDPSGQNGGTSSFGGYLSATGGQGGVWHAPTSSAGGAPGYGVGGQAAFNGGNGGDGQNGSVVQSGMGGASYWGGGGRSGAQGAAGQAPGSGGGGAYSQALSGGKGAPGLVVVEY